MAGLPARGASAKRVSTLSSVSGSDCNRSQRLRQWRTVSTFTSSWRAIWALFKSLAAAKIMRARRARCWGVRWRRDNSSRFWRSSLVRLMAGGFGPRIGDSSISGMDMAIVRTIIPWNYLGRRVLASCVPRTIHRPRFLL